MTKKPGLDAAYALESADDVRALYGDWADTYDAGFALDRGYILHRHVARHFAEAGGAGPVLDIGAGTGLVGEELASRNIGQLHATDLSKEMLTVAKTKGCYAHCFEADVTETMPIEHGFYGGIVSAGTFTLGHLGPGPLPELLRISRPGAVITLSINAQHFAAEGFAEALSALGGRITDLRTPSERIYADTATHDHAGDEALIVTFRVT